MHKIAWNIAGKVLGSQQKSLVKNLGSKEAAGLGNYATKPWCYQGYMLAYSEAVNVIIKDRVRKNGILFIGSGKVDPV